MNNKDRNVNVVFLDKSSANHHQINSILEKYGYKTSHLNSCPQFADREAQIAIFDLNTYENEGAALQEKLTAFINRPTTLAIVRDSYQQRSKAYQFGADDCIQLPIIESELLVRIKHRNQVRAAELSCPETPVLKNSLVKKVSLFLSANLGDKHSLKNLESRFGVNRNKLQSAFKREYSLTVFSWLRLKRMEKAAQMFKTSDKSISQVAYDVGYDDSNNFSTCFKSTYGESPINYRKYTR